MATSNIKSSYLDGMNEMKDELNDGKEGLKDMGAAAKQTAEQALASARETASEYLERGREQALELGHTVERQIRTQPMRAILIAAGVGFLLGACLMRR